MEQRKSFHHGDLKRALLSAAQKLLDQGGPEKVTIRATAKIVGVSHAAPINHYPDRQALLTALAVKLFGTLLKRSEARLADDDLNPGDRALVVARVVYEYGSRFPHRYQLLWRTDQINHKDPDLAVAMDRLYELMCCEIERPSPKRGVDTDTVGIALWSMVHGYLDLRASGMLEAGDDRVSKAPRFEAMLTLMQGMLK